jgi:hypothetical protein
MKRVTGMAITTVALGVLITASSFAGTAADYDADVPLAYYELSLTFSKRTAGFTPPVQSRAYGYMGLALYEALVYGMTGHRSIAVHLNGIGELPRARGRGYHWPLVASAALAEVMRGLWGGATNKAAENIAHLDALEASFEALYAAVPEPIRSRSKEFGRSVGTAVFETSKDDGGHQGYLRSFPPYMPPVGAGFWVETTTGSGALQPYWGTAVTTFALTDGAECNPGAPPEYSEEPGSMFYQSAFDVYETVSNVTPEQLETARYWADGPGSISGPGHSLAITNQILIEQGANLAVAGETYARVGIANADAVTAVWWTKYTYNLLRPITYIRKVIDPDWNTVLPSPPFPEYVSAHSSQSAAAMASLEYVFGYEVGFVDHAHDADGFAPRSFERIYDAAEEAGASRVYAGIHFPFGNTAGQRQGQCVAAIVNNMPWRRFERGGPR